ncbi:hypothetical protein FSS13T_04800 [Flavobacterium saliperosum S13]|uniref:MepB protein n=2 Tax=Flavobacterium saliperosum TaxID=329186 RepID=A0A1G4V7E1_9FLAO|nr:MepB family protein [Flavobacterium saliperosum]ESU27992.1 hypothetical protein FSS13T_04800 [Flavobacterium saliperosum S13]SCX02420.1 hypothetical protein SAMN02927925_00505 [Flavobacterium saliperosum]
MNEINLPNSLIELKELLFDKCGFVLRNSFPEKESVDYNAHQFQLNNWNVVFRTAKITPTKIGQFVTLWKRIGSGPIQPFDFSDAVDLFVVNVETDNGLGQFVFPKEVLLKQGVLTSELKVGKRAIRVYPPWDVTLSKQAQKTQRWQLQYFLNLPCDGSVDVSRAQSLYGANE